MDDELIKSSEAYLSGLLPVGTEFEYHRDGEYIYTCKVTGEADCNRLPVMVLSFDDDRSHFNLGSDTVKILGTGEARNYCVDDKVYYREFGIGTVMSTSKGTLLGVRFNSYNSRLHNLDGLCANGYGWWVESDTLSLISETGKIEIKKSKKGKGGIVNMFEKVKGEVTEFIGENKNVLYWFAIIFVVDFYVFDGKFKGKLETIFDSIIDKVTNVIVKGDKKATAE